MRFKTTILATAFLATLSTPAFAGDIKIGDLTIQHPAIRATVPGAKVAGGFMLITNSGKTADRLMTGSAEFTEKVEIHEMAVVNDIMRMRELDKGLEIPPGGSVRLKPGSFHVMFIKLSERMKEGEMRKAELVFKNAGKVDVEFIVESIATTMKHAEMSEDMIGKMEMPGN